VQLRNPIGKPSTLVTTSTPALIDKSRYPADCGCGATRVPSSQGKENGARPAKGPPHGIESRLCGSGGPFELPRTLMSRLERAKPPQVMDIDMRGVGQSQESAGRATAETLVQPPAKYGNPRAHGDRPAASLSRTPRRGRPRGQGSRAQAARRRAGLSSDRHGDWSFSPGSPTIVVPTIQRVTGNPARGVVCRWIIPLQELAAPTRALVVSVGTRPSLEAVVATGALKQTSVVIHVRNPITAARSQREVSRY
jgi:hypothetical protein